MNNSGGRRGSNTRRGSRNPPRVESEAIDRVEFDGIYEIDGGDRMINFEEAEIDSQPLPSTYHQQNSRFVTGNTRRGPRKPRRVEINDGGGDRTVTTEQLPSTSSHLQNSRSRVSSKSERGRGVYVAKPQSTSNSLAVSEEGDPEDGGFRASGSGSKYLGDDGVAVADAEVDSVLKRLEELELGIDEPQLEEDQLSSNDQQQADELVVVESMYGDNVCMLDTRRGLRSFQINIHIESERPFTLSTKLSSSSDHMGSKSDSDGFLYSFEVQYLPPIVLTCVLPKSYPSHLPPCVTIFAQWLNAANISELCSVLDLMWTEQPGQEVIFRWVEWLQNSSLSYLGFDKHVSLGPYTVIRSVGDRRAISGSVSADVDIPSIRRYNDEKCHDNFLKSLHDCCICFGEYAGSDFLQLPCHHLFCWKCMKTYSEIHIKEGTVNKLQCPNSKCGGMVPPGALKRLLGVEAYERWESLMLQKTLASMSDVVYCSRCETPCIEDPDHHALCSKCFFSFCTLCREQRHVGVECLTPEIKLRLLQERQDSSQIGDEQRRKELEMINELKSVKAILLDAKQCPSCNMAISRIEGCNKMVCGNCGSYFCYRCNKQIDGYEHFKEEGGCELFPVEVVRNWEERMNAAAQNRIDAGQIEMELFPDRVIQCPSCRQRHIKMSNNNHIVCVACHTGYCFLCKKTMRRPSDHFGPKGCKQHTPL